MMSRVGDERVYCLIDIDLTSVDKFFESLVKLCPVVGRCVYIVHFVADSIRISPSS